ncbi:hypothetical protein MRB53_040142 [Persea americana]|nr:hypothetical protein MRB53_040142 [Persea americana]
MSSSDPLILLRTCLSSSSPTHLTTTSDPAEALSNTTDSISQATHLYLPTSQPQCLLLSTPTRFFSDSGGTKTHIDLRSIYFAFRHRDSTPNDYIAAISETNNTLPEAQKIRALVFIERLELGEYLDGNADAVDHIEPLAPSQSAAEAAAQADATIPVIGQTGTAAQQKTADGRPGKTIDARLAAIYSGERKLGDHNSILRGIKPTDFSHVRKHSELFLGRRKHPSQVNARPSSKMPNRPMPAPSKPLVPAQSAIGNKRSDPIILLSPSASSPLRLTNVKSFLDEGLFVPADHAQLSTQTTANLLHITRTLPSLSDRPFRFIIVDSPDQFKPEYWSRVVAVFTTGQTWQFRGYKWRDPRELFAHVQGIYIGEKGLPTPNEVKGWGGSVRSFIVDRWDERAHGKDVDPVDRESRRWNDKVVVEELWRCVEGYMRGRGDWKR